MLSDLIKCPYKSIATVTASVRCCLVKWFKVTGNFWISESNCPVWFWFRLQDRRHRRRNQFGSFFSAAVGDRPQFCRSLSSRQDQHRDDPAQAAGPADPHGEPQLHPAGSPAGTRGHWEDTSLWLLQQNHPVRQLERFRIHRSDYSGFEAL